jgi:hypothetical protein
MSDTTEQETARDAALARTLSAMAETPPVRRRARWRGIVAVLGVFALAGAGTGALTAGALARTAWTPDDTLLASELANFAVGHFPYSTAAGVPAFQHASGDIDLHLGDGPASSIADVEVWCLGAGSATWQLGDAPRGSVTCRGAEQTPHSQALEVGPWTNAHLTGRITGDVAIWAGQLTVAAAAAPSGAQQDALADKVVTRSEYVEAWGRLAGCMDGDGYDYAPAGLGDRLFADTGVDGAHAQRFDLECYPREFQDVDAQWQSQLQASVPPCLRAHGVTPSDDQSDWQLQLQGAGLTPASCHLW